MVVTEEHNRSRVACSTVERAYSQLIASLSDSAQDHIDFADTLNSQVVEALRTTEKRHDEVHKRQMQYFQKLLSDREKAYADRLKVRVRHWSARPLNVDCGAE